MNRILKIATVLTWINMVIWGLAALLMLLGGIIARNTGLIVISFLLSVIVLHSYAALQLRKSIRNPAIPLNNQTPIGIRFIGFIALFFGMSSLANGFAILNNTGETLRLLQSEMPQFKDVSPASLREMGFIALFLGLCISLNVFMNFRLLRWYYFLRDREGK